MWITPCKRSAARGVNALRNKNYVVVQLLRSWFGVCIADPELRFACTGLSMLNAYGVGLMCFVSSLFQLLYLILLIS